jgi:hypothetical protein
MRLEIAGDNPSALESVLTEKIVGTWMLTELLDLLVSAQLVSGNNVKRLPPSTLKRYLDWQAQAHRQLLSTIKALASVRRLQSGMPASQTNVQINLLASAGQDAS